MSTNSSMDQLLDLLIDALEERRAERDVSPSESAAGVSAETTRQPNNSITQPVSVIEDDRNTRLPKAWLPFAAAQNIFSIETVTPEFINTLKRANPHILNRAKTAQLQALPDAALAALPLKFVRNMPYSLRLEVERRSASLKEIEPLEVAELDEYEPVAEADEPPVEVVEEPSETLVVNVEDSAETEPPGAQPKREITQDNLPKTLTRMFLGLILVVLLANLKIVDYGAINAAIGAAGNSGSTRVVFARDGMLMRADGTNEVYVIEENQRRWVSTLEAFNQYGYRWDSVRVVEESYLEQFAEGEPKYLLAACPGSPHIYALTLSGKGSQRRERRHIRNIVAFQAAGFEWKDISYNFCSVLMQAVIGDSIPIEGDGRVPTPTSNR